MRNKLGFLLFVVASTTAERPQRFSTRSDNSRGRNYVPLFHPATRFSNAVVSTPSALPLAIA